MIGLDSRVETVLGNGLPPRKVKALQEGLGIRTVGDLLRHFPRRYVETGSLTALDDLHEGQFLTLVGRIADTKLIPYNDRRSGRTAFRVQVRIRAENESLLMTFFSKAKHIAEFHERQYAPGRTGIFFGVAGRFRNDWQLTNPTAIMLDGAGAFADPEGGPDLGLDVPPEDRMAIDAIGALFPIYPLSGPLATYDLMRVITFARSVVDDVPDLIPPPVRESYGLLDARTALDRIHAPDSRDQVRAAQRHYRFEEALVTQLVLARRRRAVRAQGARPRDGGDGALLGEFDARLPFRLTRGQEAVGEQIEADLARDFPMNRLLQGEVGSGKTLVALRAMLRVVDSGGQAALLAPTEVLAQQHHRSITAMLGELAGGGMLGGTGVELLTGSMTKSQRTGPMSRLASGEAGIVIGTHALLEDKVLFADLGLVVVDEQHRFGVEQRAALAAKSDGVPPHVLVMTATPIPRTVAMTVFGDLETSTLDELPAGRAPIQTTFVSLVDHPGWAGRVWERVREEVAKGHQVYVVCPRIDGDELEQGEADVTDVDEEGRPLATGAPRPLAAVADVVDELADGPLAGLRVAALHGRLPAEEKDATMRAFASGGIDVLVSTTVIEVGVDVANATTMVILDADRFGISQLHQLRGRVGRGGLPGLCLLLSHADPGTPARERLQVVASTTDGFELSRLDLEQRREGDVLGRSQSGYRTTLENLRVLRDETTITQAREAAEQLVDTSPDLADFPLLRDRVFDLEARAEAEFMEKS